MTVFYLITDPLLLGSLLVLFGILLRKLGATRIGGVVAISALAGLYLLATPLVSGRILAALETGLAVAPTALSNGPEAIVVLSADLRHKAPEFQGDTVGDLTLERMRYGARLQEITGLPVLVTGGVIGRSEQAIGRLMAETYRREFHLEPRWVEEMSRNTFENASLSREILERDGIDRIYLVTHAWHMRRAVASFDHVGFQVVPAPTGFTYLGPRFSPLDLVPRSHALASSTLALHEWIGQIWYGLVHY